MSFEKYILKRMMKFFQKLHLFGTMIWKNLEIMNKHN